MLQIMIVMVWPCFNMMYLARECIVGKAHEFVCNLINIRFVIVDHDSLTG